MESSIASPDFHLAEGRHYMLGRNHTAASRLNLQYYLWKESLHFNVHPSIPIPKQARVADVATGTAIWLIDVAREHPTAQIDGFDIDLSQAPPKQWLSPNITLKTWNVFDHPSEDMIEAYDVVHVRLLVLVVQGSDPRNIIRNLLRMLKPGGYIQWDELNYPDTHIRNSDSSLLTPALHELRTIVYSQGRNDLTLRLPELFAEEGLLDTKIYHFQDLPELAKANGEQHLLTMEEFASGLAKTDRKE
jgi:SAM-dependent methyltransferase